eukprot:CAMPEP_0170517406 /NCGR_PEP_ID=MMETSP0209-20121228/3413_1 /TAXON_ID=665100 ORGANISM="Litonotus pictus, Strain P1" /NCGR_SAMPLE_ID=MMETSP0209 /ASSEMBLY_ACC=CAM_ASM_000301 /LENGTH=614 /DNA_ID=CAMNT_0010802647 /DNA_START=8 /DNA_END=1852 /DNA_ORIENTATION=-
MKVTKQPSFHSNLQLIKTVKKEKQCKLLKSSMEPYCFDCYDNFFPFNEDKEYSSIEENLRLGEESDENAEDVPKEDGYEEGNTRSTCIDFDFQDIEDEESFTNFCNTQQGQFMGVFNDEDFDIRNPNCVFYREKEFQETQNSLLYDLDESLKMSIRAENKESHLSRVNRKGSIGEAGRTIKRKKEVEQAGKKKGNWTEKVKKKEGQIEAVNKSMKENMIHRDELIEFDIPGKNRGGGWETAFMDQVGMDMDTYSLNSGFVQLSNACSNISTNYSSNGTFSCNESQQMTQGITPFMSFPINIDYNHSIAYSKTRNEESTTNNIDTEISSSHTQKNKVATKNYDNGSLQLLNTVNLIQENIFDYSFKMFYSFFQDFFPSNQYKIYCIKLKDLFPALLDNKINLYSPSTHQEKTNTQSLPGELTTNNTAFLELTEAELPSLPGHTIPTRPSLLNSGIHKIKLKESNLRKKIKLVFNSKLVNLLNMLLTLLSGCKLKSFPQITHSDPHRKNNIEFFSQSVKEIVEKLSLEAKKTVFKLLKSPEILESLFKLESEIIGYKNISFQLLKTILELPYGKVMSMYFKSDLFQLRQKSLAMKIYEDRIDFLSKNFESYVNEAG